ncbi:hypothetical protein QTQ03_15770 [Micromonospora sp. WMMA1363]|uniref:hypothetical protein n=1 Tax=Micromonospora sp. WMMA1363 TaxID=3053985 RepID=UPI00259CDC39|nr:hypothetical protein [Micromonospora sp. WMMA1363]MDM4720979.1 hypothetical protein [Micromonospora sp. WMMA1363]
MAQRSSSGRGGTATRTGRQTGNRTPNTPQVSESAITRMRVDEIRGQLRRHGVSGVSTLRKPELVKTLVRTLRAAGRPGAAARASTGPAGRAAGTRASAGRAAATRKTAGRTTTARAKAAPARAKAVPANKSAPAKKAAAKRAAARGAVPAKTAPAKPAKRATPAKKAAAKRAAPAAKKAADGAGPARGAAVRIGPFSSRSVRSSQVISSLEDRPERLGRSLVTTNHDVIRRWARQRNAKPATIAGTERDGRAGVLTFNLPGYRESNRVREITWAEWFRTFELRKLNLIYQERLRDGRPSNFFRTESPDREAG